MDQPAATAAEQITPARLVTKLAEKLHASGMPAHELEDRMETISGLLGARAHFFSTPTSLFASFEGPLERTHLIRVTPSGMNLDQMSRLDALLRKIEGGELQPEAIWQELREIDQAPPPYGWLASITSFGLVGGAAAVLFRGSAADVLAATLTAVVVGIIVRVSSIHAQTRYLSDLLAAFGATLLTHLATRVLDGVAVDLAILASLLVLLPGLSVTVAINELATQNLASGTARLAGAMVTFLTIGFGIVVGRSVVEYTLGAIHTPPATPLANYWIPVALVVTTPAIAVFFQARLRDLGWILLGIAVGYGGTRLGARYFTPEAAAWTGAFALGITSNLFGQWARRPAAVMQVPGLLLLVPGSIGFSSVAALLRNDVDRGIEGAFTMSMIAASIVAGLLMANVLVTSERRRPAPLLGPP